MPFDTYGSPAYSFDDLKIAAWQSSGSYATAVDVFAARIIGGDPQFIEGLLEGDDVTVAANSRMRRMTVEMEFGDVSIDALSVILGLTSVDGGTYERLAWVGTGTTAINAPYLGVCGRALQDGGAGDVHFWWPKAKITALSGLQMQMDNYIIPRVTLQAISDGDHGIYQIIKHAAITAIVVPPTYSI